MFSSCVVFVQSSYVHCSDHLVCCGSLLIPSSVAGLSTLAVCAPSEKFLNMGGPLAMGLGVVFVSSVGESVPTSVPPLTCLLLVWTW